MRRLFQTPRLHSLQYFSSSSFWFHSMNRGKQYSVPALLVRQNVQHTTHGAKVPTRLQTRIIECVKKQIGVVSGRIDGPRPYDCVIGRAGCLLNSLDTRKRQSAIGVAGKLNVGHVWQQGPTSNSKQSGRACDVAVKGAPNRFYSMVSSHHLLHQNAAHRAVAHTQEVDRPLGGWIWAM